MYVFSVMKTVKKETKLQMTILHHQNMPFTVTAVCVLGYQSAPKVLAPAIKISPGGKQCFIFLCLNF